MIEDWIDQEKINKYYLKVILEKVSNHYDIGVMNIQIFKKAEFSVIKNVNDTLDLFRDYLDRFISKKRKRKERIFKTKDKCNLKIILEEIIDHAVGICNIPIFKITEFSVIKNVNDVLDLFANDLKRFIKNKIIENKKK